MDYSTVKVQLVIAICDDYLELIFLNPHDYLDYHKSSIFTSIWQ